MDSECISEDDWRYDCSAQLLVTDPGHSLGTDGYLISQLHVEYCQFLAEDNLDAQLSLLSHSGLFQLHVTHSIASFVTSVMILLGRKKINTTRKSIPKGKLAANNHGPFHKFVKNPNTGLHTACGCPYLTYNCPS